MNRFVVDASVSMSWFVDDPVPDLALRAKKSLEDGSIAIVPSLWQLEMSNGFVIANRRRLLTPPEIAKAFDYVEGLITSVLEIATDTLSSREIFAAAQAFGLTAYDATYLETARRDRLPLATLDHALARAATQAGVPLFR